MEAVVNLYLTAWCSRLKELCIFVYFRCPVLGIHSLNTVHSSLTEFFAVLADALSCRKCVLLVCLVDCLKGSEELFTF